MIKLANLLANIKGVSKLYNLIGSSRVIAEEASKKL